MNLVCLAVFGLFQVGEPYFSSFVILIFSFI
nr:MAG TPA: hypothetical protein [Caudoviricetes sp.]